MGHPLNRYLLQNFNKIYHKLRVDYLGEPKKMNWFIPMKFSYRVFWEERPSCEGSLITHSVGGSIDWKNTTVTEREKDWEEMRRRRFSISHPPQLLMYKVQLHMFLWNTANLCQMGTVLIVSAFCQEPEVIGSNILKLAQGRKHSPTPYHAVISLGNDCLCVQAEVCP